MDYPARLNPFMSYYGSKWKLARHYPKPERRTIYEGFCGAAGYSCLHFRHDVHLLDVYEKVTDIWNYLFVATRDEILALPRRVPPGVDTRVYYPELKSYQRDLIGYWLDRASPTPVYTPSPWYIEHQRDHFFWPDAQPRIAKEVRFIRHWTCQTADYTTLAGVMNATIFLDPPYKEHGSAYPRFNVDYDELAEFVHSSHHSNQIICCEGEGAIYLPFEHLLAGKRSIYKKGKRPDELVYIRPSRDRKPAVGCGIDAPQEEENSMKNPTMVESILEIMGDAEMGISEIAAQLKPRHPNLSDVPHRVRATFSNYPDRFQRVAPGRYRVKAATASETRRAMNGSKPKRPLGAKVENGKAARRRATPTSVEAAKTITKAAFVREHMHLPAKEIVAKAQAQRIDLSLEHVYNIRCAARKTSSIDTVAPIPQTLNDVSEAKVIRTAVPGSIEERFVEIVDARVMENASTFEGMIREFVRQEIKEFFKNL